MEINPGELSLCAQIVIDDVFGADSRPFANTKGGVSLATLCLLDLLQNLSEPFFGQLENIVFQRLQL